MLRKKQHSFTLKGHTMKTLKTALGVGIFFALVGIIPTTSDAILNAVPGWLWPYLGIAVFLASAALFTWLILWTTGENK